ncbi:hypothetical protein PIB30_070433 [Stylosanthes scabra]|uniref:Uncharacterized protein n=1 Tax=Stylosanthes scabra TaxID=79078 RepID=A0ABU6SPT3_9FABA|nr:hypothetical protein [Stylosanthes scabra]
MLPVGSGVDRQRPPHPSSPTSSTTSTATSRYVSTAESQPPSLSTAIAEYRHAFRRVRDFYKRFFITLKPYVALEIAMMRHNRRLAGIEDSSNSSCIGPNLESKSDHESVDATSTSSERTVPNREPVKPHPRLSYSSDTPSEK